MPVEEIQRFAETVGANIERVIVGKNDVVQTLVIALLCEGHVLLEDVPGVGKTMLARSLGPQPGRRVPSPAMYARPAAQRHHRRQRLQPGDAPVPVHARPGLHPHPARRRDQPRHAARPGRPARMHGRAPGHRRRRHPHAAAAVPRPRHAEPHRVRRHLSPARSAARPLPVQDQPRLSQRGAGRPHAAKPGRTAPH